jgi:hypothetical protein
VDPFAIVDDLIIEYVDAVAGAGKTRTAIAQTVKAARRSGVKTIFVMPTKKLVEEASTYAHSLDSNVRVYVIVREDSTDVAVATAIPRHIERITRGHLLFITHEGFNRVISWPPQSKEYDFNIDEVLEVILTRKPFQLYDSHYVLTNFTDIQAVPTTIAERNRQRTPPPEFTYRPLDENGDPVRILADPTRYDSDRLDTVKAILEDEAATEGEKQQALKLGRRLLDKRNAWEEWQSSDKNLDAEGRNNATEYYRVVAKPSDKHPHDPFIFIKRRADGTEKDEVYRLLDPIPRWLLQNAPLFTQMKAWNRMTVDRKTPDYKRGTVTIIGFRRPDNLKAFKSVTIMCALFKHTMLYAVWKQLGVTFHQSESINVTESVTQLGKRKLNIYWLFDEGWSKRVRDRSGGIEKVFDLIQESGVINRDEKVCVVANVDDKDKIKASFPEAIVMPSNSRGLNDYREHNKMIHCAALNPYTSDIRWMEEVLDVSADYQRRARTGQEIYQAIMRLSIREPEATDDIHVVVMDKDVAEWLVQWFEPKHRVEVMEINSSGQLRRKGKAGRDLG